MKEHLKNIGRTGIYKIDGLEIHIHINDIKAAFGRIDYNISPISGSGEKWVDHNNLIISVNPAKGK